MLVENVFPYCSYKTKVNQKKAEELPLCDLTFFPCRLGCSGKPGNGRSWSIAV
jgi:hypothetical protein